MDNEKAKIAKLIDENTEQIQQLIHQKIKIWSEHVVFSSYWWLAFCLSIIPWILWIVFRKKQSSDRLMHAGLFVMITALVLDVLGDQFGFWYYRFNLIPILPTYFPWDLTLMPVTIMFLLQIKPKVSPFIKAVIFGLLTSYIGEPIFHWLGIYVTKNWKYTYSVPIQILIYLIAYYFTKRERYDKLQ